MILKLGGRAVLAGIGAGLIASLLQLWFVQPVLLYAELFESGQLTHYGPDGPGPGFYELGGFDPSRDLLTILFTVAIYTGWAFVLMALMSFVEGRGTPVTARSGLLWGAAGFATAVLAPAFTAAPGLPGVATIDIEIRQTWWLATVLATGTALWLIAFVRHWATLGIAAVLILAPHAIGLPSPDYFIGPAPPELGSLMAVRVIGVGLVAWVILGALAGYLIERESPAQSQPAS